MIRSIVILTVIIIALVASATADTVRVLGYIGSHKVEVQASIVTTAQRFPVKGKPDYLAITEVYPDIPDPVTYEYTVTANGIPSYERTFKSVGFGKLTYFIKMPHGPVGDVKITNRGSSRPVLIASVTGVSKAELDKLLKQDKFTILGLLPQKSKQERDRLASLLAGQIKPLPEYGIGIGFATEIRYANQDAKAVEAQIAEFADLAKRNKVPVLIGLIAWWSGTPLFVDDGAGGKFGDIKYQQICYAPDTDCPENADLKKLLGTRYDEHYRLSIPNQWSNTPWLTMNSRALNDYRFKRLDEAVGLLKKVAGDDASWLAGVYLENEPRYWDSLCEAKVGETNPKNLWADFNPCVISDAKVDGIDLNPADGLSNDELSWLHRNVGRYFQETVTAYRDATTEQSFGLNLPLYTHSLQRRDMFPGVTINHPASEWAYADGSRTGIEGMYTMPSDFYRVREWGRWANVDREENDGMSIETHLWDLRVAYMMGADLYNSYNWDAIGPERFFAYVKEFLTEFPIVKLAPAQVGSFDKYAFKMKTPANLQAFSRIEVPVSVVKPFRGSASVGIVLPDGRTISSENTDLNLAAGGHTIGFDFTTPAECGRQDEVLVVLYAFGESGRMALDKIGLNPDASAAIKLVLDLRTQRALSLAAIAR